MSITQSVSAVHELVPLLFVEDIDKSVKFYCEKLGFETTQTWEPGGTLRWCRLQRGGAAVMLQQTCPEDGPAADRGRGVGFFFQCDDARAEYDRLRSQGLPVDPPQVAFFGMNQLFLLDPDGYQLCFQNVAEGSSNG